VIQAIKARADALGRPIDEDHFGAGFAFRFGRADDPVAKAQREALQARLGAQAEAMMAVGDGETILERLLAYHAAGAHKFILRPMASDDEDMMWQTARLIAEVLPQVEALNRAARAA
jgi:alkanesulfonate monooxygenase SsuD/methylene tetrahydromethanopterin reductase-like flavin-dependent oxidoreductase (luciferase family)